MFPVQAIMEVFANDVRIGSLPEQRYQQIRAEVKRDWRLYLALLLDVVPSGFKVIAAYLLWFGAAIACGGAFLLSNPDALLRLLDAAAHDPGKYAESVRYLVSTASLIGAGFVIVPAFLKGWSRPTPGVFEREIHRRVRIELSCPVDAPLHIVKIAPSMMAST